MRREVVGFYALLLNRAPDAAGEQAWMGALQILRLSTDTLAEAFLASDEFTNRALIGAY